MTNKEIITKFVVMLIELSFMLILALPGLILGYLFTWFLGGFNTGRSVFKHLHDRGDTK